VSVYGAVPPEIVAVIVAGEFGHDQPPPLTVTETADDGVTVALPLEVPLQRESETDEIEYVVATEGAMTRKNDPATVSVAPPAQVMVNGPTPVRST
jgi:hypothetical protein